MRTLSETHPTRALELFGKYVEQAEWFIPQNTFCSQLSAHANIPGSGICGNQGGHGYLLDVSFGEADGPAEVTDVGAPPALRNQEICGIVDLLSLCRGLLVPFPQTVEVDLTLLESGLREYNKLISNEISHEQGVYFFETEEEGVVYIGKAGTLNNEGEFKSQTLSERLKAPRSMRLHSGEKRQQVATGENLIHVLRDLGRTSMRIMVFETWSDVPPAYAEAKLLKEFFAKMHRLPLFNLNF